MRQGFASVIVSGIVALGLISATVFLFTNTGTSTAPETAAGASATAPIVRTPIVPPTIAAAAAPTAMPVPASVDGETLFQRKGCIGCHNVSAAGLKSPIGFAPDLSGLAQIAPTRRPGMSAEAYVRESIINGSILGTINQNPYPQAFEGMHMAWLYEQLDRDTGVVVHLQRAEREGPEEVKYNVLAHQMLGRLLTRARSSHKREVLSLAERLGILK